MHGQGDAIWLAAALRSPTPGFRRRVTWNFCWQPLAISSKRECCLTSRAWLRPAQHAGEKPSTDDGAATAVALLAIAALLTFSRRSGPLRPVPPPSRLAPLEFVETLGGLYQQAHAASVAVDVYYQRFQYWMTRAWA